MFFATYLRDPPVRVYSVTPAWGGMRGPKGCVAGGGVCAGWPNLQQERFDPPPTLRLPFPNLVKRQLTHSVHV